MRGAPDGLTMRQDRSQHFTSRAGAANATHRFRFDAERMPRGDFTVRLDATGAPRRVVATLAAPRL